MRALSMPCLLRFGAPAFARRSREERNEEATAPSLHFHHMPQMGTCRKSRVVPHSGWRQRDASAGLASADELARPR
jgi:hypothetical protein